jgi:hypothetical protein
VHGCYGLALEGVPGATDLLTMVADSAPVLTVELQGPAVDLDIEHVGPDSAAFRLQGGGSVLVQRAPGTARLRMPDAETVPHEHVVHPFLSTSVAAMSRWQGRDVFHAGAVVSDNGAWAILGDKGQGKSTLLAQMALQAHVVLSDDLVVLEGDQVLCGPRCIDLRADAAKALSQGDDLGVVGARHRARLRLGRAPAAVPLRGWVALEWGDRVQIERMDVKERLPALLGNLALRMPPPSAPAFLRYATLPFLRLRRPRDWSAADDTVATLMRALESA